MTKEKYLKSTYFKILLVVGGAAIVIGLFRNGYVFGQWLFKIFH